MNQVKLINIATLKKTLGTTITFLTDTVMVENKAKNDTKAIDMIEFEILNFQIALDELTQYSDEPVLYETFFNMDILTKSLFDKLIQYYMHYLLKKKMVATSKELLPDEKSTNQ